MVLDLPDLVSGLELDGLGCRRRPGIAAGTLAVQEFDPSRRRAIEMGSMLEALDGLE